MIFEELTSVNRQINQHTYKTDIDQYGTIDLWVRMIKGGKGDCEDYAFTKLRKLLDLGWPIEVMVLVLVKLRATGEDHAVLVVSFEGADYALDNRFDHLLTMTEFNREYQCLMKQSAGGSPIFVPCHVE